MELRRGGGTLRTGRCGSLRTTVAQADCGRAIRTPGSSRAAASTKLLQLLARHRGAAARAPHTGFGHGGIAAERATTWTCSCGTTLPSAAILSLSHSVTALERARGPRDLGHQLHLRSASARSMISTDVGPARHQHEPGIVRVVDEQHARQRQVAERAVSRSSCGWSDQASAMFMLPCRIIRPGKASTAACRALAFLLRSPDIGRGRLAVDEPLANRVRSGRKQP